MPGWRRGRDGMPRAAVRAGAVLEAEPGDPSMKAAAGA